MEYGLVALWLGAYFLIGAAAVPLAAALFPRFPNRGAALSIPLGLAVIGIVGYVVGQLIFGVVALAAAIVALVAASYRFGDPTAISARRCSEPAAVFAVAFLFLVAVRASNPAIAPLPLAAGEKFLDFGLLQSLLRGETVPPQDMWFAGETVQYYYGGHMLTALLTLLTGTDPAFAYNLSLAGFYAALVVCVYGVAGAIADDHDAPRRLAAGLAAFFVGVASNLHTAGLVLAWLVPDSVLVSIAPISADDPRLAWSPDRFWYWDASRIIDGTINEFPLFAWLNGDLHAHMMSMPFTLLVAACCLAYWRTPEEQRRRRLTVLGTIAPIAGFIALTNTWSFPTAGGLVLLSVAFAPSDPATLLPERLQELFSPRSGIVEELRRDGLALVAAGAVLIVGGLSVLPFWLDSATSRGIGLFPERSPLWGLFVVHGGFLLVFVPYVAGRVGLELRSRGRIASATGVVFVAGVAAWYAGFAAVALFGPLLIAAWILLRTNTDVGFETVLLVGGLGLVLLVEFVHVIDPGAPERLNTVFKAYTQAWIIWAPAAGVALARLVEPSGGREALNTPPWRAFGTLLCIGVVLATGLYAGLAVPTFVDGDPDGVEGPTLDGTAYVETTYPDESAAIAWLDERDGQPTIVTAAPGGYRWIPEEGRGASAPSSLTGVPAVLGWHHQEQYRGSDPYEQRLDDVTTIYEGDPETQRLLLDRYEVRYVYVGPAERARYELTIESHPDLKVAFEDGETVVYELT